MLDAADVTAEVCSEGYWLKFLLEPWALASGRTAEYFQGDLGGRLRQFGRIIRFSETPQVIGGPPPVLGEHTLEILAELGYSPSTQERLRDSGIVA